MTTNKRITAEQLLANLNSDPHYVANQARKEEERLTRASTWRIAERPLVEELQAAGFDVESAWDLFNLIEPGGTKRQG